MKRAVLGILCVGAAHAYADTGMLPGGATLAFNRLFLHEHNSMTLVQPEKTPDSLWKYFNLAHCVCSQPGATTTGTFLEGTFAYELVLTGQTTPINRPAEIWVGASCDDPVMRPVNCHRVDSASIANLADLVTRPATPEVPVFDLMVPEAMSEGCTPRALSAAEWVIADTNATGTPDYFLSKAIDTDSLAPPLPTEFSVGGAENAIQISWTAPTGDVADIYYYQALCATADGSPAKTTAPAPQYVTAYTLCGGPTIPFKPTVIGSTDVDGGAEVALPEGISNLDPTFICGENSDKTATSLRIEGLENGKPYTVALLAIDKFGNAAGTYFTTALTPKPVTDFWEDLHGNGSQAEGGFCLIAQTYGNDNSVTQLLRTFRDETLAETAFGRWLTTVYYGSLGKLGVVVHGHLALRIVAGVLLLPLVALALAWHALTLPGLLAMFGVLWLFRRRRRVLAQRVAAATVALFLLAPARAHAQTPYWEEPGGTDETAASVDQPARVAWHAGVRVGPYIPQIDAQLGKMPGPYAAMFGTSSNKTAYAILPMLDVERIVWRRFGQLGFGGTVGYMGKSAHAFIDGSDPADPNRPRSASDTNAFRLIPLAATAVYRFTWFDDEYGVPLVPYARAGLAYYIWWINGPSGDFAKVCKTGTEPMCTQNSADGASLGVQGSVGLAIRAERIDRTAAQSMHNSGIEHAGFYGEFQFAKVDGFGSAKKLSVGDNTWFAGVDFEF